MQRDFISEKYGLFIISKQRSLLKSKKDYYTIWWDFYDEHEGRFLEPSLNIDETPWEECDIKDFSDMPKYGEFSSFNEAYSYIINKFGNIEEQ